MAIGLFPLLVVPVAHAGEASHVGPPAAVLIGGIVACLAVALVVMWRNLLDGLLVSAGLGVLTTIYLTVQHFVALQGGNSICNVSSVINCDLVNTSKHSELGGVAISLYGLGFYAGMGYLAYRQRAGRSEHASALLLVGAALAVGYDLFLAHASYQLGALCLFCAASWALNVVLLLGSGLSVRRSATPITEALAKSISNDAAPAVAMGIAVFIVGLLVARSREPEAPVGSSPESFLGLYEQTRGPIVLDGTEPVKGDPAARFTLVEFADYQCPHCGLMSPVLKKVLADNIDTKLIFKHYPITEVCNPNVQGDRHPMACYAAAAAECARLQGRFWELSEQMFKNQEYLAPDDISFMAQKQGIDVPSLELCTNNPASMDAVREDAIAGGTAQIDGTPSVFLLGAFGDRWVKLLVGPDDGDKITAVIAAARAGKEMPDPPVPAPYPE